jgi:hypothetical protein
MKRTLFASLAMLTLSVAAFAADATGKWTAEVQGRGGTQTNTFTFKVDGAKLTGTVGNQMGEAAISEGKVDGDNISFKQVLSFNGNDITISYTGVVKGDTIEMKRDAGRGPGVTFTAKKAQ